MKLLQAGIWQAGKIGIEIKAKEPMPSRTNVVALQVLRLWFKGQTTSHLAKDNQKLNSQNLMLCNLQIVRDMPVQTSAMFLSKAVAYLSEVPFLCSTIR